MKGLVVFITLIVMGILILGISDTPTSIADTSIPDNEVISGANQTDNASSTTATITITMRTPPLPDE